MSSVTPIRPDLEPIFVDQRLKRDLVIALNRDIDQAAREARDRGRIEGCICMALFVIAGLAIASLYTI